MTSVEQKDSDSLKNILQLLFETTRLESLLCLKSLKAISEINKILYGVYKGLIVNRCSVRYGYNLISKQITCNYPMDYSDNIKGAVIDVTAEDPCPNENIITEDLYVDINEIPPSSRKRKITQGDSSLSSQNKKVKIGDYYLVFSPHWNHVKIIFHGDFIQNKGVDEIYLIIDHPIKKLTLHCIKSDNSIYSVFTFKVFVGGRGTIDKFSCTIPETNINLDHSILKSVVDWEVVGLTLNTQYLQPDKVKSITCHRLMCNYIHLYSDFLQLTSLKSYYMVPDMDNIFSAIPATLTHLSIGHLFFDLSQLIKHKLRRLDLTTIMVNQLYAVVDTSVECITISEILFNDLSPGIVYMHPELLEFEIFMGRKVAKFLDFSETRNLKKLTLYHNWIFAYPTNHNPRDCVTNVGL